MDPSRQLIVRTEAITPRLWAPAPREKELTIKDLWNTLSRRKAILLGSVILFVGGGIVYCATATRLYKATSEVQVQKETADALGLESMIGPVESESDALEASITLQTQAQVLQSDSLALQVI